MNRVSFEVLFGGVVSSTQLNCSLLWWPRRVIYCGSIAVVGGRDIFKAGLWTMDWTVDWTMDSVVLTGEES